MPESSPITVSSLVCKAHVTMGIACLGSLQKYHAGPVHVIFHEDGSFTDDDEDRIVSSLPNTRVIRRKDADARMAQELRRFPAQLAFRRETCMGLKLCDTVYYSAGDLYCYSDSDVLFLRPFKNMFHLPDPAVNALFMHDPYSNSYSFRSWQLLTARNVRLPQRVNAGLTCLRRACYDPEYVEWFLSGPARGGKRHYGVPEQTAWAALGLRVGGRKWHPASVALGEPGLTATPQMIAAHFVGMFRSSMGEFLKPGPWSADPPIEPQTIPMKRCTSFHLAGEETVRILQRKYKAVFQR